MRIAHVVTYVSPDGAFGGPVRVALGQSAELAARGHEVTVYAAAPIAHPDESLVDGYTLKLFPAHRIHPSLGFAGMWASGMSRDLRRDAPRFDVAHIHLARDLVTLPAVRALRRAGVPYVAQPHGMIDPSGNALAGPVDAWETRRALRGASVVLALTSEEEADLAAVAPGVRSRRISNGVRVGALPEYAGRGEMVLFLARLHPRKRPVAFVEMAQMLGPRFPTFRFVIAGPDEGMADLVDAAIAANPLGGRIQRIGAIDPDDTAALMRSARAYVLPAVDEVFPMSVLEALQLGTPTVVTDSLGIADLCRRYGAAIVTDGSAAQLAEAVGSILGDRRSAETLREGAMKLLEEELDIRAVVSRLESLYTAAVEGPTSADDPI